MRAILIRGVGDPETCSSCEPGRVRNAGDRGRFGADVRPSDVRAIGLVLAVLLGALGVVVSTAGPAAACSCATVGLGQYVDQADVVVTGVLESVDEPDGGLFVDEPQTVGYRVRVESTYKGQARENLVFTSAAMSSSCGVGPLDLSRRYTFFLTRDGEGLTSGLCSGNRPSADNVDRRVAALAGEPRAPLPGGPDDDSDSQWWLPVTGAVLAGLGLVGLLVRRRRTSSRP